MYCMQCFLKSKYIKSRTFNDKNRWIIKKVMVFKKLLQHFATRGTYSPGDWRCDEAWHEQTLVYSPVMCQWRFIYCTWGMNVMPATVPSRSHSKVNQNPFLSLGLKDREICIVWVLGAKTSKTDRWLISDVSYLSDEAHIDFKPLLTSHVSGTELLEYDFPLAASGDEAVCTKKRKI